MNITQAIINKFPSKYVFAFPGAFVDLAFSRSLAHGKRAAFRKRYDTDEAFRKQMNSQYTYKKDNFFDFLVIKDEFREYLKPELKSAEVILVELEKASALKIKDVRSALEIAENVEEFVEMVKSNIKSLNEIIQKVLTKLSEQYSVGYYSKGFAPSSRGGWSMIRQQPHEHPREAGFPYRDWNEDDSEEKNAVDNVDVASGIINKLNPNRLSQSKMSGPGDNYGKMRTLQMRQQAKSSIHGGVGIEVEDEDSIDELDETTAANYSMFSRQPGHHAAGLHQQPSRNSGAYMQGAAVARAGQGQRGWASGIKNDDAYEEEPDEETSSPIKKFIRHSIKQTLDDHTVKPIYGKDTTGSSNRLGGYHGTNSWAKGITQLKSSGTNSSSDEDKLKLKDFIYSDAIEDRYSVEDDEHKKGK